ncbi:dihydrofolate reductase [Paenibacillus alkalitolerans]|uniref:dihydrofolate reductase n=1 Tax=Paenibacillus alkalitolerans TaxID=2799335 RepID=UPI001F348E56|nr:dihydrofolate reductase [Paenibacillus alkalitolerans]
MSNGVKSNIALIAAVAENGVIGRGNAIIWRLPADVKFFRGKTMGHPVIMGRNTFESFGGKPLKGRRNIILTGRHDYRPEGCDAVHSIEEAVAVAGSGEVYVIGGEQVYEQFLPIAGKLILTHIHHTFEGDTFFPGWDRSDWRLISEQAGETDILNPYLYTFCEYERIGAGK